MLLLNEILIIARLNAFASHAICAIDIRISLKLVQFNYLILLPAYSFS